MNEIKIYINENQTNPAFSFEGKGTKEEILNELFKAKIFACQFANKFIAINTEKILYVEISETENENKSSDI